jgi:hypothetical protein
MGRCNRQTQWTFGAIKERNLALEGYYVTEDCGHFHVFGVDRHIALAGTGYVVPEIALGSCVRSAAARCNLAVILRTRRLAATRAQKRVTLRKQLATGQHREEYGCRNRCRVPIPSVLPRWRRA